MKFGSSPQMGFGFCLLGSVLLVSLFFNHVSSQEPNTDEYYVSDFLKKMAVTPSQDFNFSAPVCSWQGVFCDAQRVYVIGLVVSGLGLSGVIPETTLGKLNKLQSLDLSNNKITSLSSDFWSFGKNLKSLNLSFNQISGELPNNIGNFAGLQSLDLSFNAFSGNIPTSLSSLLNIQILKLDQNLFTGSIPSGIMNCQSLVSLDLSSNRLNGTLPTGFSAAFPKLKALNLAGNEIHGRSSVFSGLNSITHLNISSNSFHGSVVGVFLKKLEVIDVSRNYFQGHLSDLSSSPNFNLSRLVVLDVSSNQLSGEFFHDFTDAQSLKHLNLAHNRFSEQEFPQVEKLSRLEYLNLSGTGLRGKIPTEITQLSLSTLDLSMNHLSGRIPNLRINNLQVIDLSSNNLTGEVPLLLLESLHQMERFNFSYNNLTLCASELTSEILKTSFIGSVNSCPIAANPEFFRGKPTKHIGLKLSLAVSLSTVCLLVGLLFLAFGCRRKTVTWEAKQQPVTKDEQNMSGPFSFQTDSTTWVADVKVATSVPVVIFEKPLLNITFADLLSATSHFDRGTLLAEGRFGPVYRGFLPGGVHVAVKVLVHVSTMTDQEVARDLEYLGRIRHPNLVPLTGYCLAGDQRIAIYEYMENGNLQNLLHDLPLGIPRTEDWSTDTWEEDNDNGIQNVGSEDLLTNWRFRHKIALGTARALAFLHHGCSPSIIHRDVKASSIYLDSNLEPRLSDFGLINGLEDDIPHWSLGYVPPEFCEPETGPPTLKSDVYGFGVVLFELITGKKPIGDDYSDGKESSLVSWIRGLVRKNQCAVAIDPKIRGTGSETEMEEALRIGYLCTADLPTKRPSMHQIVGLLKDIEPVVQQ